MCDCTIPSAVNVSRAPLPAAFLVPVPRITKASESHNDQESAFAVRPTAPLDWQLHRQHWSRPALPRPGVWPPRPVWALIINQSRTRRPEAGMRGVREAGPSSREIMKAAASGKVE